MVSPVVPSSAPSSARQQQQHHPMQHQFSKRDRLPTLQEVLSRNTRPPVDLYCYYLFLQREGSEDTLDFWLDVHQHENLVRAYFKDLQKNGRSVKDEWPRYYDVAKKRGSAWNGLNGVTREAIANEDELERDGSGNGLHNNDTGEKGASTADDGQHYITPVAGQRYRDTLSSDDISASQPSQQEDSARHAQRTPSPTSNGPRPNYASNFSPTLRALYPHDDPVGRRGTLGSTGRSPSPSPSASPNPDHPTVSGIANNSSNLGVNELGVSDMPSTSTRHSTKYGTARRSLGAMSLRGKQQSSTMPYIPRDSAITRTDLIASAERIYARYLMPGAEKEIYLPNVLRVDDFPISSGTLPHTYPEPGYDVESDTLARVPDMFHSQKEWVYRAMEQDSFPRFLRSKVFGNLTPMSAMIRLIAGLLVLWVALSTSFSFIFLDVTPKSKRLWVRGDACRAEAMAIALAMRDHV